MTTFNGSRHFCGLIGTHSAWIITHDYCASITRIFCFLDIVLYKQRFFKGLIQKHVIAHSNTSFHIFCPTGFRKSQGGCGPYILRGELSIFINHRVPEAIFFRGNLVMTTIIEMANRRGWKRYLAGCWIMKSG